MELETVKTLFSMYSGVEETLPYLPLILMSASELEPQLRSGADKTDCRLAALCAALANVRYVEATAARDRLSHTHAGAVAKNPESAQKLDLALRLYTQLRESCADLLTDSGFSFAAVGKES